MKQRPNAKSSAGPGKPVRLIDIAAKAGVSRSAVASVVLDSAGKNVRVGEETAKRIRAVARELGYAPNAPAQRLAGKQTRIIGVIIDSYAPMPRFTQLSEVERAADEHGYRVMVGQSHGEIEKIESYAADFVANRVDGVICISHHYPDIGERIASLFLNIPNVVFLGQPLAKAEQACWVALDHRGAMRQLVEYFAAQGREHIALWLTDDKYQDSQDRRAGYYDALRGRGVEPNESLLVDWGKEDGDFSQPDAQARLTEAVRRTLQDTPIDAVLAINDIAAMHLVRSLRELGRRVPEDVAVAGYDNLVVTSATIPSITTVDLCDRELARTGFGILLDLIEEGRVPPARQRQWLSPKLIARESG